MMDSLADARRTLTQRWYDEGFYSTQTFAEHIQRGAETFPGASMTFAGGPTPGTIYLGEMWEQSRRVAAGLVELGVGPGVRVAIWLPNWREGAITYQAALALGATVVPIVHIYGPREVGFILRDSGASVLVMPDRWRKIDYLERLEGVGACPQLRDVVLLGDGPSNMIPWASLADRGSVTDLPAAPPDEPCLLVYTSGTTADPKGVRHTTNTLVAEVRSTSLAMGGDEGVTLATFPAGHIAGVLGLVRLFLLGASTVYLDTWNAGLAARLIEEHRIANTAGAPIMLSSLLDVAEAEGADLSSLSRFMVGAASVPRSLVERAEAAGIPVFRAYGSSEHPVLSTGVADDPVDKRAGTDGRLTPGNEVRLVDDAGQDVPVGEEGEIVCRGPEQFVGYTDPRLDAESFLPGAWFCTGDIGRLDEDGYLVITDRKKDVIIRGGENIASKEVEDLLAMHAAVAEAAAVGLPDERYGERVAAFVMLRAGASLDLDAVRQHFAQLGVAIQKTPEHLVIVDDMPRTPSGKVRKVELRDQLRRLPSSHDGR